MSDNEFTVFRDQEIRTGIEYAAQSRTVVRKRGKEKIPIAYIGVRLDEDLLRNIANEVGIRYHEEPTVMNDLVREVAENYLRQRNVYEYRKFEACVCGTTKMFADRRAWMQKRHAARKWKANVRAQKHPQQKYAANDKGQFLLPLRPKK